MDSWLYNIIRTILLNMPCLDWGMRDIKEIPERRSEGNRNMEATRRRQESV